MMRTNVTFRHPAKFVAFSDEDGVLAASGAGWFVDLLRRVPALEVDDDLCQEDWGIVGIGLGAWAIGNPDRSVLLLVSIIGIWAIFKGAADLVASFEYRRIGKELAA